MKSGRLVLSIACLVGFTLLQFATGSQTLAAEKSRARPKASKPAVVSPATGEAPKVSEKQAKIVFEKSTHDFGRVAPSSKILCEFKFCNKGDSVLKITNISKTCGCTPFTLEKKQYAPGECGTLKVKYNADSGHGSRTRKLYVYSNDPKNAKVQLTIKALIVLKVEYEPKRVNFKLKGENANTALLKIHSIDGKPFAIKGLTSTNDAVSAEYDASKKGTDIALKLGINPDKIGKNVNGRIQIKLTHPECPKITVPYSVLPRFKITPPSINVLNARPGKTSKKEVWILNNYDEDFELDSTSAKNGLVKVVAQEKLGKRYKLVLEITPPPTKSRARIFTDTFYVNLKNGNKLQIPCRGFYARK